MKSRLVVKTVNFDFGNVAISNKALDEISELKKKAKWIELITLLSLLKKTTLLVR